MTKKEYEFIGSLNMTDQISNEAYGQIMIVAEDEPEECEDCIRRQAVFDMIEAYKYLDGNDAIYRLKQWLEDQEPVTPIQKWIPVTERLPDKLKNVLIVIEEDEVCEVAYMRNTYNATYKANGAKYEFVLSTGVTYAYYEVDAWMPIEPYEG